MATVTQIDATTLEFQDYNINDEALISTFEICNINNKIMIKKPAINTIDLKETNNFPVFFNL